MKVQASLKSRTNGREDFLTRRGGVLYRLPKKDSVKGGRLKVRQPIPRRKKKIKRKERKY